MLNYHCLHFNDLDTIELYDLLALRQEVFVVEQNCPYLDADSVDKDGWHVLGQTYNGTLLAYARFFYLDYGENAKIKIGRVVADKSIRGEGIGINLMQTTIEFARQIYGHQSICVSAQTYLIRFYKALGFEVIGQEYMEDNIPHISMVRKA